MDCFYCQVEQVRLGLSPAIPLAVQQWDNVIAVNYAARAAGVTRHSSFRDCFKQCSDLKLVHVPTFNSNSPAAGIKVYPTTDVTDTKSLDRTTYKASLQPYRQASSKVFSVLRNYLLNTGYSFVLEKASVDEVYLDVSEIVDARMEAMIGVKPAKGKITLDMIRQTNIPVEVEFVGIPAVDLNNVHIHSDSVEKPNTDDYTLSALNRLRISIGTNIAQALREAVFKELSYTVSAGIAHNKTLAKLASAKNKPNKQTYVTNEMVSLWMATVPFNKIRFLGGKLGKALEKSLDGHATDGDDDQEDDGDDFDEESNSGTSSSTATRMAKDLWKLSLDELKQELGDLDTAKWAYKVIRGQDDAPVAPRLQSKSFMAAKELRPPIKEWAQLHDWIVLLCTELTGRLEEEISSNSRWPQSLTIHFKRPYERNRSKAIDFPFDPSRLGEKVVQLADICINQLASENRELAIFPCSRIALAVGRFQSYFKDDKKRARTLDEFMTSRPRNSDACSVDLKSVETDIGELPAPQKSKKDIRSLFKPKVQSVDDTKWKCQKCAKAIDSFDADGIREHEDYHFALELQKQIINGD